MHIKFLPLILFTTVFTRLSTFFLPSLTTCQRKAKLSLFPACVCGTWLASLAPWIKGHRWKWKEIHSDKMHSEMQCDAQASDSLSLSPSNTCTSGQKCFYCNVFTTLVSRMMLLQGTTCRAPLGHLFTSACVPCAIVLGFLLRFLLQFKTQLRLYFCPLNAVTRLTLVTRMQRRTNSITSNCTSK